MARAAVVRQKIPLLRLTDEAADVCLELQDHSTYVRSATAFFQLKGQRDPHAQAARLADQFVANNRSLAGLLDVDIHQEFDGKDVKLVVQSGSSVGAVPLVSPLSARSDFGLVVQPRFPWAGLGPMLSEMGWRVVPSPLHLPLLRRSERRVPPWVLSSMVLTRLRALLQSLTRRFELVSETVRSPKGSVNWGAYACRSVALGDPSRIPATFPDLRDDRLLKGAIRYTIERHLQALYTQSTHGSFVHQLIELAQSLIRQVSSVPPSAPTPQIMTEWTRRPLRSAPYLEGLQAIEWTVEERGLAGLSDLAGIPWRMPMDGFFEAWVETVFHSVAKQTGGQLRTGRKNETVHPMRWNPPYLGSQKSLRPDLILESDRFTLVVDAKYKRHWEELQQGSWHSLNQELQSQHRNDLLQILAYGNLAQSATPILCLIYPCAVPVWNTLVEGNRWLHRSEISAGSRSVHLWLAAVPMGLRPREIAEPFAKQIQQLITQA